MYNLDLPKNENISGKDARVRLQKTIMIQKN